MSLSRSRTITLVVAIATLSTNTLSTILFHQLPDDPYRLAANFSWYLHFANILSVFGFIGAIRQHALSISIFSTYLLFDTLIFSIPRFVLLSLLQPLSGVLCAPSSASTTSPFSLPSASQPLTGLASGPSDSDNPHFFGIEQLNEVWSEDGCHRIVKLAQWTLTAGVVAATLLQFVGALCVREYGHALARRDDAKALLEDGEGGVVVMSEGGEELWVVKVEREADEKC